MPTFKSDSIRGLTTEITGWANETFPDRTPASALLKLFGEIGELIESPRSPGEYADICILLFDLANMHGIDLGQAIWDKMQINKGRTWSLSESGTYRHIEGECQQVEEYADPDSVATLTLPYNLGYEDAKDGLSPRSVLTLSGADVPTTMDNTRNYLAGYNSFPGGEHG
jgi:NTP pyrophosphatase (non-canonical NTP hydrolase)